MRGPTVSPLLDVVEEVTGCSCYELSRLVEARPGWVLEKKGELFTRLDDSYLPCSARDEISKREGLGRVVPIYGGGVRLPNRSGMSSIHLGYDSRDRMELEAKSLLLYADELLLLNPLGQRLEIRQGKLISTRPDTDGSFLASISVLAGLEPLIRRSVVTVVDLPLLEWDTDADLRNTLGEVVRPQLVMGEKRTTAQNRMGTPPHLGEINSYGIAEDAVIQSLTLAASGALEMPGTVATPSILTEQPLLHDFVRRLAAKRAEYGPLVRRFDAVRLERIVDLALPGVGSLPMRAMHDIRNEGMFVNFRSSMREALKEIEDIRSDDEPGIAQSVVQEFMRARASELSYESRLSRFMEATLGDAVAWGVGVALTSLYGWQVALLGLLAKGAVAAVPGEDAGRSALRQHYVSLGQSVQARPRSSKGLLAKWNGSAKS